jgi:hypothetical protein
MVGDAATLDWLLDPGQSDPAIRWQVLRDLQQAPESAWSAERARVETEGVGARLLAAADDDGQWDGGAHFPADWTWGSDEPQPWTSTSHSLTLLRTFGLDPSSARAAEMVALIGANCRWEHDNQPYWEGEVEPCINGTAVANGSYFGVDMSPVVDRLTGEVLADGGWNCEAEYGSVRSSFDSTINVLEGLHEFERATGGTEASRDARRSGEEYLLRRSLFRRLSTGAAADEDYLRLLHPFRWHHSVLRALDHFREASLLTATPPDARLDESIGYLRSRRLDDGRWPLDHTLPGRSWFDLDAGEGEPSRWVTLRAMRILAWWDAATPGSSRARGPATPS